MPNCKGCAAPIRWETTVYGKTIPLDAEPVALGNLYINEDGKVAAWNAQVGRSVERFVSHFATCPQAEVFREPA